MKGGKLGEDPSESPEMFRGEVAVCFRPPICSISKQKKPCAGPLNGAENQQNTHKTYIVQGEGGDDVYLTIAYMQIFTASLWSDINPKGRSIEDDWKSCYVLLVGAFPTPTLLRPFARHLVGKRDTVSIDHLLITKFHFSDSSLKNWTYKVDPYKWHYT